jgi:hypothetical protein
MPPTLSSIENTASAGVSDGEDNSEDNEIEDDGDGDLAYKDEGDSKEDDQQV